MKLKKSKIKILEVTEKWVKLQRTYTTEDKIYTATWYQNVPKKWHKNINRYPHLHDVYQQYLDEQRTNLSPPSVLTYTDKPNINKKGRRNTVVNKDFGWVQGSTLKIPRGWEKRRMRDEPR